MENSNGYVIETYNHNTYLYASNLSMFRKIFELWSLYNIVKYVFDTLVLFNNEKFFIYLDINEVICASECLFKKTH